MSSRTWTGAVAAGSLALAAGCAANPERKQAAAPPPPATEEQRAQAAATQADQELVQARQRLEAAHQGEVQAEQQRAQARQEAAQAEASAEQARQRISQEQAEVQRLDATSREQHARAVQATMDAQVAAEEAQGLATASGRIAESTPTRMVLQVQEGGMMAFDLGPRTKVLVGIEQRSVADLQQGADARVAYDDKGAKPTAVVIHVTPARAPMQPQQPVP